MGKTDKNFKKAGKDTSQSTSSYLWYLFGILVITFVVYSPALDSDFVNWDDETYIEENPIIQKLSISNFKEMFRTDRSLIGNYHPLTELSFAFNFAIFKLNPGGYIATNILLHLLNTILVFFFFYRFSDKNILVAFVTTLFFSIHPMHVESVCWISERKDVLYVFFYLFSLLAYLHFLKNKVKAYYFISLLLFILSLLSKAQAVTLPLVLALLHFWYGKHQLKSILVNLSSFFAFSIIFGLMAIRAQNDALTMIDLSIFDRIIVGSLGLTTYLIEAIIPYKLSALHPYPPDLSWPVHYYLLPVIALGFITLILWTFKRSKSTFFGLSFFFLTILPVLQLMPVGMSMYAERYTYLPYLGLFFLSARYFDRINNHRLWSGETPIYGILLGVMVIFYAVVAHERTKVWHTSESLWLDVIDKYPKHFVAYVNITNHYIYEHELTKAIEYADRGIETVGHNVYFYDNKAYALMMAGNYDVALEVLQTAKRYVVPDAQLFINEGDCFLALENPENAISSYSKALQINSNHFIATLNRGKAYFQKIQDYPAAISDFSKALQLIPNHIETMTLLALAYHRIGKTMEALQTIDSAIMIDPDNEELSKLKQEIH